ncbi:protein mono-ADP-ribosyltransferase PARP14-like isoform X1 [Ranitomeya imitator]|uniref:protein mono-ADP-ribosyltransferase PARP14-like isoform X1 n=1 Tax=Ranitomeya imitator TaxID=111125 RepID=UPI0037E90A14
MAHGRGAGHYSEESQSMNKALPFSEEETGIGLNGQASGINLPEEILEPQGAIHANCVQVIVKFGNLEQQKVDGLAFPLLATKPCLDFLNITKELKVTAGNQFSKKFYATIGSKSALTAGHCIPLPTAGGSYNLECKCVIFIICSTWSKANNSPEQDLRDGIRKCLNKCSSMNEVKSVAVSAVGTGKALNFPNELAATIMGEEIKRFVDNHPDTHIKEIQIVIKQLQENEMIYIAYRETLLAMDLGQRIHLCNENGGHFLRINHGECTQKNAGRVAVSVVYDSIVTQATDAIVNSTNFTTWGPNSEARSIFTAAGADIVRKAQRGHNSGEKLVMTTAGPLPCTWILHCNCNSNLKSISPLMKEILDKCEHMGLNSVAMPAFGTGECKLRPEAVANEMMKGILSVVKNQNLTCLSCVRLITYKPYIYHTFCAELRKHFI